MPLPREPTVRDVVIAAVKPEMTTRLVNIQTRATIRPGVVLGVLSPYPTVVMVTAAHQNPDHMPSAGPPPKLSGFLRRSNSQTRNPERSSRRESPARTRRNAGEKQALEGIFPAIVLFSDSDGET